MDIFFQVQTRSEETGLCWHDTLHQATTAAEKDKSIWKISFILPTGEPVRLVYNVYAGGWLWEPIVIP